MEGDAQVVDEEVAAPAVVVAAHERDRHAARPQGVELRDGAEVTARDQDRKSTRLNSSHGYISYAVFCLKKKKTNLDGANTAWGLAPLRPCRPVKARSRDGCEPRVA